MHDGQSEFVGWEKILELYGKSLKLDSSFLASGKDPRYSLYLCVLFETGCRVSEAVLLRPDQFKVDSDTILVRNAEVLKRRKRYTRNIIISREENPLANPLVGYVKHALNKGYRYLLPGLQKYTGKVEPLRHVSVSTVYNHIVTIDPGIWNHWLRDQRSWHLSEERGFDAYLLKSWFSWARMDMPALYAGRRSEKDILTQLGIEKLPR